MGRCPADAWPTSSRDPADAQGTPSGWPGVAQQAPSMCQACAQGAQDLTHSPHQFNELRVRVYIRFPKLRVGFPVRCSMAGFRRPRSPRHWLSLRRRMARRMAVSFTRNSFLGLKLCCRSCAVHLGVRKVASLCCAVRFQRSDSACAQHMLNTPQHVLSMHPFCAQGA